MYVQNCSSNLLSISLIVNELNCEIIFSSRKCDLLRMDNEEGNWWIFFFENGLYFLSKEKCNFNVKEEEELGTLWHKRIGHLSNKILKHLFYFKNLDCSSCEVCKLGKYTRLLFDSSNYKSKRPFELIHLDIWGSTPIDSFNDYRYLIIFIDDFLRTT